MLTTLWLLVPSALVFSCLAQSSGGGVTIDPARKRAEILVERPAGRIVIHLEPLSNLLMHTFNVYDLFGHRTEDYGLRSDEAARLAVSSEIRTQLGGMDKYFSRDGKVSIYSPTLKAFLEQQAYLREPDEALLATLAPAPFNTALGKMWKEFYQGYWYREFPRLSEEFRRMDANIRWSEMLDRMERVAGRKWQGAMQVFAVEATGKSAFTFARTVCIGTLQADNDAGFVHEGLHLLLQKEWSRSPRIVKLMTNAGFQHKFWGADWASFYEQAFVVLAEIQLRDLRPRKPMSRAEFLRLSLEANGAGDFADLALEIVLPYVENPDGRMEEIMWQLLSRAESKRRAAKE